MSDFYRLPSGIVFDMSQVFVFHRNQHNGYLVSGQSHVAITAEDADALEKHFSSRTGVVVIQKVEHPPADDCKTVADGNVSGPVVGDPVPCFPV